MSQQSATMTTAQNNCQAASYEGLHSAWHMSICTNTCTIPLIVEDARWRTDADMLHRRNERAEAPLH